MKVVIVGGVAGGASAAARIRRLDETAEIIVLEKSRHVSYANCGLPYYVGGVITDESRLTLQTPDSFFRRFAIDVRVLHEAISLDVINKTVSVRRLADGTVYSQAYDKLILATGACPVVPDVNGIDNPLAFTLRNVEDAVRLESFVSEHKPKTAVVIGGGYIGLECAENLIQRGVETTLLQSGAHILPTVDYDMARQAQIYLQRRGLKVYCDAKTIALQWSGQKVTAIVADKKSHTADFAVVAAGVVPDTALAVSAGLKTGIRGAVVTDEYMATSAPDVYAVGDAVQIKNTVTGTDALISLAGPANKQGRIAADNICGKKTVYRGAQASSVIKLFDMTVGVTGLTEDRANAEGIAYGKVINYSPNHATYYPGATDMTIKTLYAPDSGKILGAQIVGFEGVDKRTDVMAVAVRAGMTARDLAELDLAYAPPYSSAKDPVNMAGYTIGNVLDGTVKQFHWHDIPLLQERGAFFLDVRTPQEFAVDHIAGAVNVPLDELRARLGELDKTKTLYVNCHSGLRSYLACRILSGNGFDCCNLSGGFRFLSFLNDKRHASFAPTYLCGAPLKV